MMDPESFLPKAILRFWILRPISDRLSCPSYVPGLQDHLDRGPLVCTLGSPGSPVLQLLVWCHYSLSQRDRSVGQWKIHPKGT
jgi:hypothetical protein